MRNGRQADEMIFYYVYKLDFIDLFNEMEIMLVHERSKSGSG